MKFNSGIIRYNLIQDCLYSYVHYSMGGGYFQFSNNVFYRSKDGNGTSNFDPWGGGTASYVNNVFYDGKGTGFGFSGGTSFSYKNNAYYGTPACWKDSSPIMLSEDPFVGTAPSMSRLGNAATGALLEANGLMPKTGSALVAAGASTDATGTALTDGLFAKGSRFNFTSLAKAYGSIVPMAATAYPVFDATDSNATLNTSYTHTAASTTAPTIGLFEVSMPEDAVYLRGTVSDDVSPCSNAKITVTVNGKTVETTTNASGTYTITEGLTAGEATVTAVVEGRDTLTKTITLAGGKVNILDIAVPMPAMPNAYSDTLISEAFDENAGALAFNTKATVADGRLALAPATQLPVMRILLRRYKAAPLWTSALTSSTRTPPTRAASSSVTVMADFCLPCASRPQMAATPCAHLPQQALSAAPKCRSPNGWITRLTLTRPMSSASTQTLKPAPSATSSRTKLPIRSFCRS